MATNSISGNEQPVTEPVNEQNEAVKAEAVRAEAVRAEAVRAEAVRAEAVRADFKKSSFDREFRMYIKQAGETIATRHSAMIEMGDVIAEQVCLNRYLNIYNAMTPEEHFEYVETMYNRDRIGILNTRNDDSWIRKGSVVIQFGQGVRGLPEKCKQVRIMVSNIYQMACELQVQAEKRLEGLDEKYSQGAGGKDLIRPTILLLHLFRMFYYLNDGIDKPQLGAIVSAYEEELGLTKKTVGSEPWNVSSVAANALGNGSGLSGIFTMATTMMEKLGYKPPEGIKAPTESEITNIMTGVFNHETTQNAIQGMFTQLQGCNDFNSMVQTVVKSVADPNTMEAIQGAVIQTANIANESAIPNRPILPQTLLSQTLQPTSDDLKI